MIGRRNGFLTALVWLGLSSMAAAEQAAPTADPDTWSAQWWPQLRFASPDGAHWVRLGGRLLLDGAEIHYGEGLRFAPETGWTEVGKMRQGRVYFEGLFFRRVELKTEVDFAPEEYTLNDAYLGLRDLGPLGTARFGNHKQPFSFEKQMSRKYLVFMERSLSEAIQPDLRDIGFSLRSAVLGERLRWVIGGFRDTESTGRAFTPADNWSLAMRVTGLPLWEEEGRRLVHLGFSYNHQFRDGPTFSVSWRPESFVAASLVDTGTIEGVENIDRVGLDVVWVHGPVSLQAEWNQEFLDRDAGRGNLDFWGCYVQASWFPTGEHRRYQRDQGVFGPVIPLANFEPWKGGWGAVQLGARFSYLDLDDRDVSGGIEKNVGLAVNWFLLAQLRFSANWIYGHLNGQGDVHVLQGRFQIEY